MLALGWAARLGLVVAGKGDAVQASQTVVCPVATPTELAAELMQEAHELALV